MGAQKYAVRAQLDPSLLAARGIGIDDVESALEHAQRQPAHRHALGSAASVHGAGRRATDGRRGVPAADCRLPQWLARCASRNLGRVIDSVENDKVAGWFNQARSITLMVQRQPGTNTVEVVDRIKELLPSFREQMPPSVKLEILYDRSESIRESVNDVKFTLVLTIAPGGDGDLSVLAQCLRHGDSQPGAADLDHRHVRARCTLLRLHAGQSLADGADAFRRVRGGRRHRDAGKHRAPHGDGQAAHAGRVRRARAKSASPFFP